MSDFSAELIATAKFIATPGKGILAADESTGTIGKRLASIGVANNEDERKKYRTLLATTKGLGEYISGVILYEETLFQDSPDGKPISEIFKAQGIVLGIKVDKGVQPLYNTDGETVTQGITGLAERCKKYYARGARFAKWRAVCHIKDSGAPTQLAIDQNAETLARYGAICQANGLVPIIEPEVLMDGKHDILRSAEATQRVQAAVVYAMQRHKLLLEGILLKPNMVRPGASAKPVSAATVARATVRVLQHTLPAAVPGVHFLSGGMTEEFATECLNEMNKLKLGARPWSLSFSFGRALQQSCLKAYLGKKENVAAAQEQLLIRAKANGLATLGKYGGDASGSAAAGDSLHVEGYVY